MILNYISYNRLIADSQQFAKQIPAKYDVIVGIPRSGLIPAAVIGFFFNKPVMTFSEYSHVQSNIIDNSKALLVDDSITSGNTIKKVKNIIGDIDTAILYTDGQTKNNTTYIFKRVNAPRVFQWNIFNHGHLKTACLDFDGVLCKNPDIIEDDNKPEVMRNYILNVKPLHVPNKPIFTIITNRIERYRKESEQWLKNHSVKYDHLIMYPGSANERRAKYTQLGGNGIWKAQQCNKIGGKWFIESSYVQAQQIRDYINKSVYCTDKMIML